MFPCVPEMDFAAADTSRSRRRRLRAAAGTEQEPLTPRLPPERGREGDPDHSHQYLPLFRSRAPVSVIVAAS